MPGFSSGYSAISGHLQGNRATGTAAVGADGVGAVGYSSTRGLSPLESLFGVALGHSFDMYRRENMGVGTVEEHLSQRVLDKATQLSTIAFLQASNPILTRLAQFTITFDQQVRFKQTSYNMIPAQPQGHMTIPKFNTRTVLERMVAGQRSGAAAEARMEELLNPISGPPTRDFMINSVTASVIFEEAQLILGTAVSEARIGVFVQTGGQRGHRFASLDRQLLEEVLYFGAMNRSYNDGIAALNHAINQFNQPGEKLAFLPYSAAAFARRMPANKAVGQLAALTIAPSAARVLGFDMLNRSGAWSLNPETEEAFTIANNDSVRVYVAPQNSMEYFDDETLGCLDSYVTLANWWRNPVLGNNGMRNPRARFGDEAIYDYEYDTKQPVLASAALQHLGIWRDGSNMGIAGVYPDDMSDAAVFTPQLRNYVAAKRSDPAPGNHDKYTDIAKTARMPLGYITSAEHRCDEVMPFSSYWEGAEGSKEWFIPHHIGEMHPEALPHAATLTAARELMNFVADHPGLRDLGIHPADAFAELFRVIDTIIKNTEYNANWIKRIVAANQATEVNKIDGAIELKRTSRGGLVLPTNENYTFGGERVDVDPYPANAFGYGCWSGPMLRELAAFDILAYGNLMTQAMRQVCQTLQTLIPQIDRIIKVIQMLLPESPLFAFNCASPWVRSRDDGLAALVGHLIGDTPLFVKTKLDLEEDDPASLVRETVLRERPVLSIETLLEALYVGDVIVTADGFQKMTDALGVKFQHYFPATEAAAWRELLGLRPKFGFKHAGITLLVGFVKGVLDRSDKIVDRDDDNFANSLGRLSDELKQLLEVGDTARDSVLYKDASESGNKRMWVMAHKLVSKLLVALGGADTKEAIATSPTVKAWLDAVNSIAGPAPARVTVPPETVSNRAGIQMQWARTPLCARFKDVPVAARGGESRVGDVTQRHAISLPNDGVEDLLPLYVDPDDSTSPAVQAARTQAVAMGTALARDGAGGYAMREAYAGVRPVTTNPITGAYITSNIFQMHKGSSARASLLQFRHQMFKSSNNLGGSGKLFEICWLAYIMTPLTLYSMETLFREQRILPPIDIGYARWSQIFQTGDVLLAVPGAVKVHMAPLEGYLTLGNMHRMVLYNLQKRSLEYVENHKDVYLAHSMYVQRNVAGRNTGFMSPNDLFGPDFFFRRDNMNNIMPIVEKITHRWDGILHLDNDADLQIFRDVKTFGSVGSSNWTARAFYVNYLYKIWYQHIQLSRQIRGNLFTPAQLQNNRGAAGLAGKQTPLVGAMYAFRGESVRPNEVDGQYTVVMPGAQYSPLGHQFWNMQNHRKALDGQYSFEDTVSIAQSTFA